jgi:hypothetical protein
VETRAARFVFPRYGAAGAIAGKFFGYSVIRFFGSVTGTVARKQTRRTTANVAQRLAASYKRLGATLILEDQDHDQTSRLRTQLRPTRTSLLHERTSSARYSTLWPSAHSNVLDSPSAIGARTFTSKRQPGALQLARYCVTVLLYMPEYTVNIRRLLAKKGKLCCLKTNNEAPVRYSVVSVIRFCDLECR